MAKLDLDAIQAKVASLSGIADPDALSRLKMGAVFEIADDLVPFPHDKNRTWHEMRRVIVVQADSLLGPVEPRTVMVVPCSASQNDVRRGDYVLPKDEPGFTRPHVVAYATLVMPILKSALTLDGYRGQLTDETLAQLRARIAQNLGLGVMLEIPPRTQAQGT